MWKLVSDLNCELHKRQNVLKFGRVLGCLGLEPEQHLICNSDLGL